MEDTKSRNLDFFWDLKLNVNLLRADIHQITTSSKVTLIYFRPLMYFYRNQSFDLQRKSNVWFLYEMQHWTEMGKVLHNLSNLRWMHVEGKIFQDGGAIKGNYSSEWCTSPSLMPALNLFVKEVKVHWQSSIKTQELSQNIGQHFEWAPV